MANNEAYVGQINEKTICSDFAMIILSARTPPEQLAHAPLGKERQTNLDHCPGDDDFVYAVSHSSSAKFACKVFRKW